MARNLKVLVIEDSPMVRDALAALFRRVGGIEVVAALSGESGAIAWLAEHPTDWDLATVDLVLADGSGFNLIRRLHELHPYGSIVVFSEFSSKEIMERCIDLGADMVFLKSEADQFAGFIERVSAEL